MRTSFFTAIIIFTTALANADDVFSSKSFDDACASAAKEKKVVLIDFYTTWCGPCKRLDSTTWQDKDVQTWLRDKTIPLKIDAEKQKDLAKKYKVTAYPTILLLKPDGTEIDRLVGYKAAEEFLEDATDALSGKDAVARARDKMKGSENAPLSRMRLADSFAAKGMKKEALEEYLWCFDHGLESPGFYGVRLSFLLGSIHRLGASYPPAIEALEARRDNAERIVLGENHSGSNDLRQAAIDLSALTRELGDAKRALKTYDKIRQKSDLKEARQALLRDLLDTLIEAKRYKDIVEDIGDIEEAVEKQFSMYRDAKKYTADNKEEMPSPLEFMRTRIIDVCGKYYEAALGAGHGDDANEIADQLLEFDATKKTYRILMTHAIRAGHRDAAELLLARAEKSLKKEQVVSLRTILEQDDGE
ncbi:MAG: thioredoxin family protein [Planctomycetes bacterium]|nr:thioredoxin family protein [Planctomycetota bacterium]